MIPRIQTKNFKISLVDHGAKGRDIRFEHLDERADLPLPVAPVLELIEELSDARDVIDKFAEGSAQAASALREYLAKHDR